MLPPGAQYLPDYIDRSEAIKLLSHIDNLPWLGDLKRRVQHYGYRYDYKARRITTDSYLGALPDWLDELAGRLRKDEIFDLRPDQVIVNEYLPGQGIAAHVDCEPCFGETIASLSLGSPCVMEFSSVQSGSYLARTLSAFTRRILAGYRHLRWVESLLRSA